MTYNLFISYMHQDEDDGTLRTPAVRDLAAQLEGAGLSVFRDETSIETFEGITPKVQEGIENARALLVYFSHDYTLSRACLAELRAMYIAASQNGWKPAERIFILNPESHCDHFDDLPVDLRDINAARSAASAISELPALVENLDGTFGRRGLRDRPIQYGRSLTGSKRFVGRTREMWEIHSLLNASECAQITGHAGHPDMAQVSGMGGIGKSLLAEEYALRFGTAYPGGIFWLSAHGSYNPNAPDIETFAAACKDQLLALAESLGMQLPPDTSLGILQHTIRQIIESNRERCLWVVDDVPCGLAAHLDVVKAWFSPHPLARTLITTRSREYQNLAGELALELLDDVQAKRLLRKHNIDVASQEEDTAELLERLAGHALALDVAGAAIEENGGSVRQFLDEIEQDSDDLLNASEDLTGALPTGHAPSIVRTFKHSIDRLDEPGKDLLRIAACLSPEPIGDEFIEQVFRQADDLEENDSNKRAKRALRQTAQYSLINRQADHFTVHALISATVHHLNMTTSERGQTLLDRTVELLHDIINPQATREEAAAIALEITHARFLTASVNEDSSPGLVLLLVRVAEFDFHRGNVHLSVKDWRQIVSVREKTLGLDHPDTLTSMNNLAEALSAVGDPREAKQLHQQVLKKRRRLLGRDQPLTLTSMDNLARTFFVMGEHVRAKRLQEEVLTRRGSVLGLDDPSTVTSMGNLASTLHTMGDFARAKELQEQVVEKATCILGSDHLDTLTGMSNLATTLSAMGDQARARRLKEQVLGRMRRTLGPDHPVTLTCMNNLAVTLHIMRDHVGAWQLQEQVLEESRASLGSDHPDTTQSAWNLFFALDKTHAYEEAQAILETDLLWLLKKDLVLHDGQQKQIREMLKRRLSGPDNPYEQTAT